jgi:hypothetical protein
MNVHHKVNSSDGRESDNARRIDEGAIEAAISSRKMTPEEN